MQNDMEPVAMSELRSRHEATLAAMPHEELDVTIVTAPDDIYFPSGSYTRAMTSNTALILALSGDAVLVTRHANEGNYLRTEDRSIGALALSLVGCMFDGALEGAGPHFGVDSPAGRSPGGTRAAALCRRGGRGWNAIWRRPQPGVRDPAPRRAAHRRPAFVRTAGQPTRAALAGNRPGGGAVQAEPATAGDGARVLGGPGDQPVARGAVLDARDVRARATPFATSPDRDPARHDPEGAAPAPLALRPAGNPTGLRGDRYEFWIYRQISKRLASGELAVDDSLGHRRFRDELVAADREAEARRNLDLPWLNQPVEATLELLCAHLDRRWQVFGRELRQGKLKHLDYDPQRHRSCCW